MGERCAVLVASKGLVPPLGTTPSAFVAERVRARAVASLGGPAHAREAIELGASVVLATRNADLLRQLARGTRGRRAHGRGTDDVTGAELASCAKNAAALASAAAAPRGANLAGAAAGRVFAEVHELALAQRRSQRDLRGPRGRRRPGRDRGGRGQSQQAGRRAGRAGVPAGAVAAAIDQTAESLATVPLLGLAFERDGIDAPVTDGEQAPRGDPLPSNGSRASAPARPSRRRAQRHRAGVGSVTIGGRRRQAATRPGFHGALQAHLRDVYRYSYYRVGNHHDAEDLTEQTFLQAYRHFDRAQRESKGRPMRPWLIRIAHNLAANYYRDRSRRPMTQLDATVLHGAARHGDHVVEGREEVKHVLEGVAHLPGRPSRGPDHALRAGMDNREIAGALGRSEEATKVFIHRAIKQLEEGSRRSGP